MNQKIIFIIDGNSLINREFYGMPPLSNKDGIYTNAVLGFANKLIKYTERLKPDYKAAAFDLPAPTFRHLEYTGYKARRKGMPDELAEQLPYVKELCGIFGFEVMTQEGFEADDIIGTVAKKGERTDCHTYILTGDRDSFQLVSDNVSVLYSSNKSVEEYTPEKICLEYGVKPGQLVDVKALMGDSSDEIPGVRGIGEKTALKLIAENNSLDELYNKLDSGELKLTPSNMQKLTDGRENAFMSRRLAGICVTAPADLNFLKQDKTELNRSELYDFCKKLDFKSIIKKLDLEEAGQAQLDIFGGTVEGKNVPREEKPDIDFNFELAAYVLNPSKKFSGDISEKLYEDMTAELRELELENLYYNVELPLADILREMETAGFLIDREGLGRFGEELGNQIAVLQTDIHDITGVFNINSPKQLGEILFDKLGLPGGKKGKTGHYSTNIDVMEKLKPMHPVIGQILDYRALTKLKSTYCDGILKVADNDGRVHTSFNQSITATGRLSSTEPNFQNIPVRTDLGREIRKFFIAGENKILIDADYSQIELRVLAHISGDETLIDAFRNNLDIHRLTASQVFGVPEEFVTPEMRGQAKAVNFGIVYGMSDFSLSEDIGVSVYEARRYID